VSASASIPLVIALSAVITAAIKAAGPIALGGRELPAWFTDVIRLMAPALLAALVVTGALANGRHIVIGADTAGVAVAGVLLWREVPIPVAVIVAAAVTAGIRAL
jgi:branched-subunit amino acid transport protein